MHTLVLGLALSGGCSEYRIKAIHPESAPVEDETQDSQDTAPSFEPSNSDAIVARTLLSVCEIIGPEDCSAGETYASPTGEECADWSTHVLANQDEKLEESLESGKTANDFWNGDHAFRALLNCEEDTINSYHAVICSNTLAPKQDDGSYSYENAFYCQSRIVSRDGGTNYEGYESRSTVYRDGESVDDAYPGDYSQLEENAAIDPLPETSTPAYDFNNFWWYSPEGDRYEGEDVSQFEDAMLEVREAVEIWMDLVGDPRTQGNIEVEFDYDTEEL